MATQPLSLKGRALRHLAAREHSRAELLAKLAPHVIPPDDDATLARVLDELTAKGFISEARVAQSVLHRRAGRLGAARVLQELRAKGLSGEVLEDAAEQLRGTELARAREVWRRKFGVPPQEAAERARQMRFLAGRGFSGDVVRRVVSGADDGID
ncbi:recombination regulator RecX [Ottowia sp.]|uniref:recombination regulator RecX n=1 Tax=Ottowia sp. TaxID=1898956 RepID=UPI0025D510F1|nr:recombination regulator RecX [Ottowia sp.]MBK6614706.1 recombination regulator RecX [Ottowia sp.]MBK6745792.1 recombination regulator RecX [Ottowia sp.]